MYNTEHINAFKYNRLTPVQFMYSIISVSLYFVVHYMQQEKHAGRRSDGNSERFNLNNCNSRFGFHTTTLYVVLSLYGNDGAKTEITVDFLGTILFS